MRELFVSCVTRLITKKMYLSRKQWHRSLPMWQIIILSADDDQLISHDRHFKQIALAPLIIQLLYPLSTVAKRAQSAAT